MRTFVIAAALAALAAPAFAAPWSAVPAVAANKAGFVADTVIWDCNSSGCATKSDTSGADELSECKGLAREVGTLTSFTGERGALSEARLATCNKSARKTS
jgi:hypothetical protein